MRIGRMRHTAQIYLVKEFRNSIGESENEKVLFATIPCSLDPVSVQDSPSQNANDQIQNYKIVTRWSDTFTGFIHDPDKWQFKINGVWYQLVMAEQWFGLDRFVTFNVKRVLRS